MTETTTQLDAAVAGLERAIDACLVARAPRRYVLHPDLPPMLISGCRGRSLVQTRQRGLLASLFGPLRELYAPYDCRVQLAITRTTSHRLPTWRSIHLNHVGLGVEATFDDVPSWAVALGAELPGHAWTYLLVTGSLDGEG